VYFITSKATIELDLVLLQIVVLANTVNTYSEVTALFLRYLTLKQITTMSSRSIEQFNYDLHAWFNNKFNGH